MLIIKFIITRYQY